MNSSQLLRTLVCGALMLAAAPPARAEGTFDIPAGAHFNQDKLAKISEFFRMRSQPARSPARTS